MRNPKAAWWQLYILLFFLAALLLLEYRDPFPNVPPDDVGMAIFALFVGVIALWLALNRQVLRSPGVPEDELRKSLVIKIYENGRPASMAAKLSEPTYFSPSTPELKAGARSSAGAGVRDRPQRG